MLDASALVELLLNTQLGVQVAQRIANPAMGIHTVHLADLEVVQALRRFARMGELSAEEAGDALGAFRDLDLERHSHEPYLGRVWSLRSNLTAYDAAYVALAEALGCPLLTGDRRIARAAGIGCPIQTI